MRVRDGQASRMPIRTTDAEAALRQILQEKVQAARGNNQIISKAEAATLDPFLQRADAALRAEGGAGSRVRADALVDKAAAEAKAVWGRFNPAGTRDGLTLARAEVAQVKAADPALGALTELALLRVGGRSNPTAKRLSLGPSAKASWCWAASRGPPMAKPTKSPVGATSMTPASCSTSSETTVCSSPSASSTTSEGPS
jgi:hypothetical protein